jgi:hypothetical protein
MQLPAENLPAEFRLTILCGMRNKRKAQERAVQYAAKAGCPVYAFPTPKGFAFDVVPPLGWAIVAQPSGVVSEISAPIV